jgi:hypothetical protein
MPLFTVTMKSRSTNEKDRLSRAIHAASIVAGYPEDDLGVDGQRKRLRKGRTGTAVALRFGRGSQSCCEYIFKSSQGGFGWASR